MSMSEVQFGRVRRRGKMAEGAVKPGQHRRKKLENLGVPDEVEQELRDLAHELEVHDALYYNQNEPCITDAEYDELARRLEALERAHPLLVRELASRTGYVSRGERVGSSPVFSTDASSDMGSGAGARFAPVKHGWPMLSLDNAFSEEEVAAWATRLQRALCEQEVAEGRQTATSDDAIGEGRSTARGDLAGGETERPVTGAGGVHVVAELKIDGVSLSLRYEDGVLVRGATRGNGFVGEDVTENVRSIASIPHRLPPPSTDCPLPPAVEVRGEVYLPRRVFEDLNEARKAQGAPLLSNPRNAASGSLRQLDVALTRERRLGFFAYGIEATEDTGVHPPSLPATQVGVLALLEAWGFEVAHPWAPCRDLQALRAFHRRLEGERSSLAFDIDGVVYKLNDLQARRRAGRSARAPRWAIAHKFSPLEAVTRVRAVDVQVGRTGVLTPVAVLEPVTVGGVVITRASLHNFQDVARRDVRVGDLVAVRRAGDVIPQVLGRANLTLAAQGADGEDACYGAEIDSRSKPISTPTRCPSCAGPVSQEEDQVAVYCPAGLSCPAQSLERLAHFVSRGAFDIKGLGGRRLQELRSWEMVETPTDLFSLASREAAKKERRARGRSSSEGSGGRAPYAENAALGKPGDTMALHDGSDEVLLEERAGWGEKSVTALFSAIAARRKIPLSRFIFALGVTHVGQTTAQAIAAHFGSVGNWWGAMQALEQGEVEEGRCGVEDRKDMEEHLNGGCVETREGEKNLPSKQVATAQDAGGMDTIEGIGPTVIASLRAFVRDERNKRTVEALFREIEVLNEESFTERSDIEVSAGGRGPPRVDGPLVGKTVLFTGALQGMTRSEVEAQARQMGATPVKTLSKKVDMIVVGASPGSKARKGRDLGIEHLEEAQWLTLVDRASKGVI